MIYPVLRNKSIKGCIISPVGFLKKSEENFLKSSQKKIISVIEKK